MTSIGTCPVCKNQIGPARGIHTIGEKDPRPTCDDNWQAQSATPTLDQGREPAGTVMPALVTAIAEGQEDPLMTPHAAIGVLVAVSLPIWLVAEQAFTSRARNAPNSAQHAEGQIGASNVPGAPAAVSEVTRATSSTALAFWKHAAGRPA